MPADCVSASGALVLELGPDVVAVAAINDGQLTECRPGLVAPSLPDGTVAVPVARHDPGGRVAKLVDQGVPYPVRTVQHFGRQLDSAQAHIFRESSTCVRKALMNSFIQNTTYSISVKLSHKITHTPTIIFADFASVFSG